MTPLLRKLLGMNWLLFAAVLVIALAGILFIHGASYLHPTERYWQQQAKWVGIGLVVFFKWAANKGLKILGPNFTVLVN